MYLRDFRTYTRAEAHLGEGLTIVHGANGAGKSNLLEGLYFGCTGHSQRTRNERELVRFGAPAARVAVELSSEGRRHELTVGFQPGTPKHMTVDGAPVERLTDVEQRPLVSVFSPDRLDLLKGPPTLRRSHLDQLVAALWPPRVATRRDYSRALVQRNALIASIRASRASRSTLPSWDLELARHALALRDDRAQLDLDARAAIRRASHPAWFERRSAPGVPPPHKGEQCGGASGRARGPPTFRSGTWILHARAPP